MIANFFNETKPINFLVLSILIFIFFFAALFQIDAEALNLYFFVKNGLFLFLAVLTVFVLNFIIRKNGLTGDNSYAILFFILFCSLFPQVFSNERIFLSNFILLLAFRRIYSLRTMIQTKEKIFDSAFWIGIASLFYVWSLIYLLLVYAAIFIFRKIDWRNFLIPLLGVLTPVFLSYTYLLAFDDLRRFNGLWIFNYDMSVAAYNASYLLFPLALIGILALIAIYPTTRRSLLAKIDFKATWSLLITHLVVSLIVVAISAAKDGSELLFIFFPVSVLFANYIQVINRYWLKESIIYLFVLMIAIHFV